MVFANVTSVGFPLLATGASLREWSFWILCALLATQHHHSGRRFAWTPSFDHQPDYHSDHHLKSCLHYGNLGFLETFLKGR
jgi:sterol desaturase/sphingolipid hydroxylase (fatty acid hydroxylase superfamily)